MAEELQKYTTFADLLRALDNGGFLNDCSEAIKEIVGTLSNLAGDRSSAVKGSLTVKVDFRLDKGVFELIPELKVTTPKQPRMRTIAWSTPENFLCPSNPAQLNMFGPRKVIDVPGSGDVRTVS